MARRARIVDADQAHTLLSGHKARTVTQGYVHIDEPLRAAADRVATEIAQLLDKGETLPLRAVA